MKLIKIIEIVEANLTSDWSKTDLQILARSIDYVCYFRRNGEKYEYLYVSSHIIQYTILSDTEKDDIVFCEPTSMLTPTSVKKLLELI